MNTVILIDTTDIDTDRLVTTNYKVTYDRNRCGELKHELSLGQIYQKRDKFSFLNMTS